jgi:hypothetical protein
MTVTFLCPHCGHLCAFDSRFTGKPARCVNCDRDFIVPSSDNPRARKIEITEAGQPVKGFYHALFVETWPIFIRIENLISIVFLIAIISFKFFVSHVNPSFVVPGLAVNLPVDWIVMFVCWGCLFWFYMAVVEMTAFNSRDLPDIDLDGGFSFLWTLAKSIYLFLVAIILAEIPFVTFSVVLYHGAGVDLPWLHNLLVLTGLFFFPMTLLAVTTAEHLWTVFRPDYLAVPVLKAFGQYFVCAVLMALAGLLQLMTVEYGALKGASAWRIAAHLVFNIIAVFAAIAAMRAAGLFYRHYECYFPRE